MKKLGPPELASTRPDFAVADYEIQKQNRNGHWKHHSMERPVALIAGLLVMVALVSWLVGMIPKHRQSLRGTQVVRSILADTGTPRAGALNADVTIVEFSDYQCAPCKVGERAFESVIARDGRIRVIYKDWPILGSESRAAARIALAAARQGKYLAAHQAFLQADVPLTDRNLRLLALKAGVDWPMLQVDLARDANSIDRQLSRHAFQAWSVGLQGPPGYLIGPYLMDGQLSESDLRGAIAAARHDRSDAAIRNDSPREAP